jgi:2-oxoglutarate ferredoxin oxidoreductase subunit gamma
VTGAAPEQVFQIRLSGSGGQGLMLAASILTEALTREGRMVSRSQGYEPTSRGGLSRADLVVGSEVVDYPLPTALDLLLVLDACALAAGTDLVRPGATVLTDSLRVPQAPAGDFVLHPLPFTERARALGNERVANIVALGAIGQSTGLVSREGLAAAVRARAPRKFVALNLDALGEGYRLAGAQAEPTASLADA